MSRYSADHLEILGKNASARFRAGQAATLTTAVIDVVKTAGLLPEQVRRVVEYANTDAFLAEFRKEGAHKVVDLAGGPASPFAVLQELNQPVVQHYDRGTSDYDEPPTEKRAEASSMELLRTAFQTSAGADYPYENPLSEVTMLRQKLAAAEDVLTGQLTMLEGAFQDTLGQLYGHVKHAALEGVPLGDVVQAWAAAPGATPEHTKLAFAFIAPKLVEMRVFRGADAIGASLEKFASGRLVNEEHPLVTSFGDLCEVVTKLAEVRAARTEISEGLRDIGVFLKHALDATELGIIPRMYKATAGAGQVAGEHAAGLTRTLLGQGTPHAERVGRVVSKTVKHAPTIAGAVGLNEARRALKHNPTFQDAKNSTLSVVPGTSQYQQREMELASGGFQMPMGY